jgi:HlyD family secretion protein
VEDQVTLACRAVHSLAPGSLIALLFLSFIPSARLQAREVRATGTIHAVRKQGLMTPQVAGGSGRLTLVLLAHTGQRVKQGDVVAEFDRTLEIDKAREAEAKYEDLSHQVNQKKAENRSEAEKRAEAEKQAEADLAKAEIQIRKGPILSEIERLKAEVRLEDAKIRLASLKKSHAARERAAAAALRILELKRDREKVALERALRNTERLILRAPLDGMVALENIWRSGSMGPPQEGDQLWPGQPVLRIFDPNRMEVHTQVAEPDGAVLQAGLRAKVYLDAYPDLVFDAHLVSASPIAASAIGSPIKRFVARFRIDVVDPHLLPDLAAAVVIEAAESAAPKQRARR